MYFKGKVYFVLGLLARDIANYSYGQNVSLTYLLSVQNNIFFHGRSTDFEEKIEGL